MKATVDNEVASTRSAPSVFRRVLVGIDGSPESREAARQAARLMEADGRLTMLSAYDIASPLVGGTGIGVPAYYDEDLQRERAAKALQHARDAIPREVAATAKAVRGTPWAELILEAESAQDTLIAVGSGGIGRTRGIVVGSTATELAHKALCSVLIARKVEVDFPQRIAVGVDGSPKSAAAYEVARALADRLEAELWPVVAHGGEKLDRARIEAILDRRAREDLSDEPVPALLAAGADADLVVVGSRGLRGLKALGSVSERVAHRARSSVLIVRRGGQD